MDTPHLSVVIPNYNYGRFLEECLDSLACQSLDHRAFEVLVADDGSTDDSAVRVAAWTTRSSTLLPRFLPGAHVGKPGAVRNRGVAEAKGSFIVCLDADDALEPQALELLLAAARGGPQRLAVCDCLLLEEGVPPRLLRAPDFDPDFLRRENPVSSLWCAPRALWDRLGGYSEQTMYEDWELLVRAVAAGYRWVRTPMALLRYRRRQGYFSRAQRDDAGSKASIVLSNPAFYDAAVRYWAEKVMQGAWWMPTFPLGVIPDRAALLRLREECRPALGEAADRFFPPKYFR